MINTLYIIVFKRRRFIKLFSGALVGASGCLNDDENQQKDKASKILSKEVNESKTEDKNEDVEKTWEFFIKTEPVKPIVKNNELFVGDLKDRLFKINASNGKKQWIFNTGKKSSDDTHIEDKPVIKNEGVFVSNNLSEFFAINSNTGKMKWRLTPNKWYPDDGGYISKPIVDKGNVYIVIDDFGVHPILLSIDSSTGSTQWKLVDKNRYPSLDLILSNDKLYFSGLVLDPDTGEKIKTIKNLKDPFLNDGVLYGGPQRTLIAYDTNSSKKLWENTKDELTFTKYTATVKNNSLMFITERDDLISVDTTNGEKNWSYDLGNSEPHKLVAKDDLVYSVTDDSLIAINISKGKEEWVRSIPHIDSAPQLNGNSLYISEDGNLYCFRPDNGELKWKKRFNFIYQFIADAGKIYVFDKRNNPRSLEHDYTIIKCIKDKTI